MIVNIVPITRLRRNTNWWSYKTNPHQACPVGSLVVITFKNQLINGIVWSIEEKVSPDLDTRLERVVEIIQPSFLLPQHLRFIEWLADYGFCSLSQALYMFLPGAVRKQSHSPSLNLIHQKYQAYFKRIKTPNNQHITQNAFIFSHENKLAITKLSQSNQITLNTFYPKNDQEELINWYDIRTEKSQCVIGREGAIFAPFCHLTKMEVFAPEDVAYYSGQAPYFNLVEATKTLTTIWNSATAYHTHLPQNNSLDDTSHITSQLDLIDIRKEGLLGNYLIRQIKEKSLKGEVVIIYNKRDRTEYIYQNNTFDPESTIRKPGVETLRTKLAVQLNRETILPKNIHLDTRKILREIDPKKVSLYVLLNSDYLTNEVLLPNLIDNLCDIFKILKSQIPFIVQSGNVDSALIQALQSGNLTTHLHGLITEYQQNELPPFRDLLVCSYPGDSLAIINNLQAKLPNETDCSAPFIAKWHNKDWSHLIIYLDKHRIPKKTKDLIMSLPAPWRIQRNPWYVI